MVTVKNLTKQFDNKKIIDNLSLVLKEGSITTLMELAAVGKPLLQ